MLKRDDVLEVVLAISVVLAVFIIIVLYMSNQVSFILPTVLSAILFVLIILLLRFKFSPDKVKANQTRKVLTLASRTLEYMRTGLTPENAAAVCKLILPETTGMKVVMTDTEKSLGMYGAQIDGLYSGAKIRTEATRDVIETQELHVVTESKLIDLTTTDDHQEIPAAVIAPLVVREQCVGTVKVYYRDPHLIDNTQVAIVRGLSDLLSTQLSLAELDRQSELAAQAELKALQSQINPHFLFNTLNTIAALIRTNPKEARRLVREISLFYRQTLENSQDFITLDQEIEQTMRYVHIEIARFGSQRITIEVNASDEARAVNVPSFIIQPIVENSIQHAMPEEGKLTIQISARRKGDDLIINVADDGVGMNEQAYERLGTAQPSEKGTGIAMKNVSERLKGVFKSDSSIEVETDKGLGTNVSMHLVGAFEKRGESR